MDQVWQVLTSNISAPIPLLIRLCFSSTVGRSSANVGAQADPSSRGGEREGERLTTGERLGNSHTRKETKEKDVRRSDITTEGTRPARTEEDNKLRGIGSNLNIFYSQCWMLMITIIAWLWC